MWTAPKVKRQPARLDNWKIFTFSTTLNFNLKLHHVEQTYFLFVRLFWQLKPSSGILEWENADPFDLFLSLSLLRGGLGIATSQSRRAQESLLLMLHLFLSLSLLREGFQNATSQSSGVAVIVKCIQYSAQKSHRFGLNPGFELNLGFGLNPGLEKLNPVAV